MKKMIFIILFTFVLIFTNGIYLKLHALSYPSEVDVVWISFNYDQNSHTYDALSIKENATSIVYKKEWENSDALEIAYIKNQTNRRIQVLFHHNQDTTQSYSVVIEADVDSGTGLGNGSKMVYFPSYNKAESDTITFQLNGTLPSSVGIEGFKFTWDAMMPVPLHYGYTGKHKYFVLLNTPKNPMIIPWVDVLDYACDWADGETNSTGVAEKVTEGIYYMGDLDGDIDYNLPNVYSYDNTVGYRRFKLTVFLNDIITKSTVEVNCTDCANLFNIFSASLGLSAYSKRIWDSQYPLFTKSIDPIGTPGWQKKIWGYHHFGWFNNKVNDACIRVGSGIIPTNMGQSTYDDALLKYGSGYSDYDIGIGLVL